MGSDAQGRRCRARDADFRCRVDWGVPTIQCTAEKSHVKHAATNRSLSYGELVGKAATLPVPTDVPLKQSKDYKIVGKRLPRVDTPSKVNGDAVFGIDFRLPDMKYAFLSRCPMIGGKVSAFDDKESRRSRALVCRQDR